MSKRKHFVVGNYLMCGKARGDLPAIPPISVSCRRCLGRMMRDAEADYERHTTAAKEARRRVAQLSAQLRSGDLVF